MTEIHGIEPRYEEHELWELSNDELINIKRQLVASGPRDDWSDADYNFILEEIAKRFAADNDRLDINR
jgi:hypothetical protein